MKTLRIIQKNQKQEIEAQLQHSDYWANKLKTEIDSRASKNDNLKDEEYYTKYFKYERHAKLSQQIKDVLIINEALGKLNVQWCEDNDVDFGFLAQAIKRLESNYDSIEISSEKM